MPRKLSFLLLTELNRILHGVPLILGPPLKLVDRLEVALALIKACLTCASLLLLLERNPVVDFFKLFLRVFRHMFPFALEVILFFQ